MKKYFIILFFILTMISIYSAETWLSAEYQYGFYFFKGEDLDYDSHPNNKSVLIDGHGINIRTYTFWKNQNVGLFTRTGLTFPRFYDMYKQDKHYRSIFVSLSFGAGVGFRHVLSEKSNIHYAFGLNFNSRLLLTKSKNFDFPKYNRDRYANDFVFNIISDIGYKYNISNKVYLNAGANVNFGFAKYLKDKELTQNFWKDSIEYKTTSKWAKGFFSFEFLPYFGIGFIIN